MSDVIISVDIETGGPVPGKHPLLSIGAVAYTVEGVMLRQFSRNIAEGWDSSGDGSFDRDTAAWWFTQPAAFDALRDDKVPLGDAMFSFYDFVRADAGLQRPVFLAAPVVFDYPFVQWAFAAAGAPNPFHFDSKGGLKTLDLDSFAAGALGVPHSVAKRLPARFTEGANRHTHIALEDAIDQGTIFFRVAKEVGWPSKGEIL